MMWYIVEKAFSFIFISTKLVTKLSLIILYSACSPCLSRYCMCTQFVFFSFVCFFHCLCMFSFVYRSLYVLLNMSTSLDGLLALLVGPMPAVQLRIKFSLSLSLSLSLSVARLLILFLGRIRGSVTLWLPRWTCDQQAVLF